MGNPQFGLYDNDQDHKQVPRGARRNRQRIIPPRQDRTNAWSLLAAAVFTVAVREAVGLRPRGRASTFEEQQDAREWLADEGPGWLSSLCLYGIDLHFADVERVMNGVLLGVIPAGLRRGSYTLDELIAFERRGSDERP
jgi:hypothetical protein